MPRNSGLNLFIPITKIDEEKREVWGTLTQEIPDRDGEVFDYDSSKPHFQQWSDNIAKATNGASLGNLREMHRPSAVGKLIAIDFNDPEQRIDIGTKVVDDAAWSKVLEGVYTGFSAGGKYVRKWNDPKNPSLKRFEAVPAEASLVDYPAVPTATYALVKAGGAVETHSFRKIAERENVNPKSGKEKYGDVKFADEKNKKYPLDTKAHVRAAMSYWGMPKNRAKYSAADQKTIGGKIHAAARRFGIDASEKAILAGEFAKGLWDVGRLADAAQSLSFLQQNAAIERDVEGDDSAVPDRLTDAVEELLDILEEMTGEECEELMAQLHRSDKSTNKGAGLTAPSSTTRTPTMPTITGDYRKAIAKKHVEKLAGIVDHAKALHNMFGEHVEKMAGSEHHEMAKALHTMMGDHCEKLAGFQDEVGGLPTTQPEGDEQGSVKVAKDEFAKMTGERADFEKRALAAEGKVTALEGKNTELQGQLEEALEAGEKLTSALETRKGALLSFDRGGDGNGGKPMAKSAADDKGGAAAPATEPEVPKQYDRGLVRKAMKDSFRRPTVSNGLGGELQIDQ